MTLFETHPLAEAPSASRGEMTAYFHDREEADNLELFDSVVIPQLR